MFNALHRKRGDPLPLTNVPYGLVESDGFATYSIDRLTFKFWMPENFYQRLLLYVEEQCNDQDFVAHRFSQEVRVFQHGSVHVEFWCDGNIHYCRVDFNPNKCLHDGLYSAIFRALRQGPDFHPSVDSYYFDLQRVDFALDIPLPLDHLYVLSRKTEGCYKGTRYYGISGSDGRLRVYDKRQEIREKNKCDLGHDLTRVEWEQRNTKDFLFKFDKLAVADFSSLQFPGSVLRFIPPEQINSALRECDPKTKKKYLSCFSELPYCPSLFVKLLDRYMLDELCLLPARWDYVRQTAQHNFVWLVNQLLDLGGVRDEQGKIALHCS